MKQPKKETREMFAPLSSLMVQLSRSLGISERKVAVLLDENKLELGFGTDTNGKNFVSVRYGGKSNRIYKSCV